MFNGNPEKKKLRLKNLKTDSKGWDGKLSAIISPSSAL